LPAAISSARQIVARVSRGSITSSIMSLPAAAGNYTWIPFGGGVRRCVGASFALFEMRTVLQSLARRVHVEAADPDSERISRRGIFFAPQRRITGDRARLLVLAEP
jgi:cytochrome P450